MKQPFYYYLGIFLGLTVLVSACANDPSTTVDNKPTTVNPSQELATVKVNKSPLILSEAPPVSKVIPNASPRTEMPVVPTSWAHQTSPVPGGIAWVPLHDRGNTPPSIVYQQQRVVVLREGQHWVAVVGIPLTAKLGSHQVENRQTGERYTFQVTDKKYKVQHLKIKNKRQVNPYPEDVQRIQREAERIKQVWATPWRPTSVSPLPLMQPVQGRFSGFFGARRIINGQPRKPHTGVDIAAPKGASVFAAGEGIVVDTGDYFFTGNTIFIDHGQGVVTMYCHLDSMIVIPNQTVTKGQVIGTVGKTGRVTGPHLHWSVSLNNTMVEPMSVIEKQD